MSAPDWFSESWEYALYRKRGTVALFEVRSSITAGGSGNVTRSVRLNNIRSDKEIVVPLAEFWSGFLPAGPNTIDRVAAELRSVVRAARLAFHHIDGNVHNNELANLRVVRVKEKR